MWTLLLLLALTAVSCECSTGVNFIPQNEFYSTYSMWALTFSIDLNPYYDNILHINNTIDTLKSDVTTAIDDRRNSIREPEHNNVRIPSLTNNTDMNSRGTFVSSLNNLKFKLLQQIQTFETQTKIDVSRTLNMLNGIRSMYTQKGKTHSKRSLLPWGGDLLNSLFGTATESDMDGIRNQLTGLSASQNDLVHVVENSLTMVNKTNTVAAQNRHAINTMTENIALVTDKLSNLRNLMMNQNKFANLRNQLSQQVNLVTNLMRNDLQKVNEMVYNLANELNQALQGDLSATLVEQSEFRNILSEIAEEIPDSLSLKSYEGINILWYYKNLPVTVIPDQNKIHVLTVVPLIPLESLFTLYRVVALPLPIINTIQSSEVILEGTHFAVSNQGNAYVILDEDELAKCSQSETTYCPLHRAAMNLARAPCCLGSLFLEDETSIQNNCPVKISDEQNFPRFRHLIHGKWMIATREKLVIHPKCNTRGEFVATITVSPPMAMINLNSGCTGYSEFATLPPYFYKSSVEDTHSASYGRLNIGSNMDPIYNLNLSNYKFNFQLANTKVPTQLLPEEKPDDVRFLKEQLRSIDRNKIIITSSKGKWVTVLGVVLGVVLLCVLLALGYLVYRLKYVRPPSNVNVKFDRKNSEVIVDPGQVSFADQGSQGLPEPVANLLGSRMDLTRSRFI